MSSAATSDGQPRSNSDASFGAQALRSIVERVERVEEEMSALRDDRKEIYAEAKGVGFDTKTIRAIVALRKIDAETRAEQEALQDLYLHALGMRPAPGGAE